MHGAYPNIVAGRPTGQYHDTGNPGNNQFDQQIVALPDGGFVVLWTSNTDGGPDGGATGTDVIGQRYDVEGQKVGAEFRAFAAGGNEGNFAAAARPDGSLVIAYEDDRFDINGFKDGTVIRAVIVTPEGTLLSQALVDDAPLREDLGGPSISVNLDGSFIVSYQNRIAADAITSAEFAAFDATGGLVSRDSFSLPTGALAVGGQHTDSALLANGNTVVTFPVVLSPPNVPTANIGIYFVVLSPTGTRIAENFLQSQADPTSTITDPTVTPLPGGGLCPVLLQVQHRFGGYAALQRRWVPFSDSFKQAGVSGERVSDTLALPDGSVVVAFQTATELKLSLFDFLTGVKTITVAAATTATPTLTLTEDGRILVGWTEGAEQDVRFAIYDPRGFIITGTDGDDLLTGPSPSAPSGA